MGRCIAGFRIHLSGGTSVCRRSFFPPTASQQRRSHTFSWRGGLREFLKTCLPTAEARSRANVKPTRHNPESLHSPPRRVSGREGPALLPLRESHRNPTASVSRWLMFQFQVGSGCGEERRILHGCREAAAERVPHALRRSRLAGPAPGFGIVSRGG